MGDLIAEHTGRPRTVIADFPHCFEHFLVVPAAGIAEHRHFPPEDLLQHLLALGYLDPQSLAVKVRKDCVSHRMGTNFKTLRSQIPEVHRLQGMPPGRPKMGT